MAGKKTNEAFMHTGGILIVQTELNGGSAELHAKIGQMNFGKVKSFTEGEDKFEQIKLPRCSCKFILTGSAEADASSVD
jgi:hypothetical protein